MKALRVCLLLCLLQWTVSAAAQDGELPMQAMVHGTPATGCDPCCVSSVCDSECCWFDSGWFVGLGGSYNSVKVDSNFSGTATTNVFDGATLVAVGEAGGPAPPFHETLTTFAPVAQLGYFQNFERSDWLWGAKFSYKYLGLTFSDNNVDSPQVGTYTILDPPSTTSFTGNATAASAQTSVNHELALIPFIGQSFKNGRFYLGGGPVVFGTESRFYDLSSHADIDGVHTNIGGAPLDLASSTWMWGGAAQMGLVYYVRPSCFFDFSYDYMVTGKYTQEYPKNVTSQSDGLTYESEIIYKEVLRVWAQSFTVSVNLKF